MNIDKIIKKINKYYLFINYNNKIKLILNNSNKKEIFLDFKRNYLKKIKNFQDLTIILFKIKKVNYNPNQPIKMVFGPVKIEINFFELTKRGAIKTNNFEKRNNHLFYTLDYLEKNKKISITDLKKVATLAFENKLEKRLLAPKTIDIINK